MLSASAISMICTSTIALASIAAPILSAVIANRAYRANAHFDKFLSEKCRCLNHLAASFAMFRIRTTRCDVHIGADGLKEIAKAAYELASYCGEDAQQKLWRFIDTLSAHFFASDETTDQRVFNAYTIAVSAVCKELNKAVRKKSSYT